MLPFPIELIRADDADGLKALLKEQPANLRDEQGISLLFQALYHGKRHLAELVASHLDELDIFEASALDRGHRLEALLERDPDLVSTWSPDGFTPLHLACFFGAPVVLGHLLARGAEVNAVARNPMKVQPLHGAVATGQETCVKVLLDAGAEVDARQHRALTPLMAAAAGGNDILVEMLLAKGADRALADDDGRTAADYAREKGHQSISLMLQA